MSDYDAELIRAIPSKLRGVEWWRSFALSAIDDLTRAEARHRRHLARLRWRRRHPLDRGVHDAERFDRLLARGACHPGRPYDEDALPISGPLPEGWSAYLAAEAAASGGAS